jgi:3-oxoacyl-[acyl-carrier protein] reductase
MRAFICGASQGIGQATAIELANQGIKITLFSRNKENLEKSLKLLKGDGHDYIVGDIGDSETWKSQMSEKHNKQAYSILILNSGGPKAGPISKATPQDFLNAMTNHLVANSIMLSILLESMKEKKMGRIVTITSTSVKVPIPNLGVSNTARAAVASWAKTISLELAPFGITVNNIMPGFTKTPRLDSLITDNAQKTNRSFEDVSQEWQNLVPMKRFAEAHETAALIGFLTSEKAAYITGQSIAVDGGRLGCL